MPWDNAGSVQESPGPTFQSWENSRNTLVYKDASQDNAGSTQVYAHIKCMEEFYTHSDKPRHSQTSETKP
jgi:hypothetical protein